MQKTWRKSIISFFLRITDIELLVRFNENLRSNYLVLIVFININILIFI